MAIDNPSNLMPDQEIIIEGDAGFVPKASPSDAGKVLGVLNSSGDVGWVVDQSGTFIQVQADWAETDSSQPSYIDHKPDLSVYATASSVETALSGKQDTISDLSEIRAGAAKGGTAVQPSALDDYATTSAMNTALAGKQDTISDLATIRSGASAGATAVQPSALESYATTSAMNTALAEKQDVINDLSDIRSGAAAGATAVQPSALESYATTSAMNTALAGKQDVINDLATIRAGAALGATAAQPSDLPSSDELLPSSTSVDAGKVLTVGNDGTASWITPSAGTVYTPGDGVDISNDVISADVDGTTIGIDSTTKKIKSLQVIPTKTSDLQNDSNFVVASSLATVATSGSYADLSNKPTIPSVDQTYNASSTNAQSGAAVAQAIASIPSSSYTAGDGIAIESGEISVAYNSNTLDVAPTYSAFVNLTPHDDGSTMYQDGTELTNWVLNGVEGETIRVKIPSMAFLTYGSLDSGDTIHIAISDYHGARFYSTALSMTYWGGKYMIDAQTVDVPLPVLSTTGWGGDMSEYPIDPESPYIRMTFARVNSGSVLNGSYTNFFGSTQQSIQIAKSSAGELTIKNPLPASTSTDANKVLTVDSNGAAGWQTPSTVTVDQTYNASSTNAQSGTAVAQAIAAIPSSSYTAGDGLSLSNSEFSVNSGTGLEIGSASKEVEGSQTIQKSSSEESYNGYLHYLQLNADLVDAIENGGLTVTLDPNFGCPSSVVPAIVDSNYTLYNSGIFFGATNAAVSPGAVLNISLADRNETYSKLDFNTVKSNPTNYYLIFAVATEYSYFVPGQTPSAVTSITTEYSYSTTVQNAVNVSNPLPASAQADSGKVLKVNASGNAEWGTDGFTTTAGITDIQQVAALPANPVATVLYLIPET